MSNDFTNYFWVIGQAILNGGDPYSIIGNVYPPITCFFFTVFAILPKQVSWVIWLVINVLIFVSMGYKKQKRISTFVWIAYTPLFFTFVAGQLDLFIFWLSSFLTKDNRFSPLIAAFITLKPQLALIVLPAVFLDWFLFNKKKFVIGVLLCIFLQGLPVLYDSTLFSKWMASLTSRAELYQTSSPGLFSLTEVGLPVFVLIPIALVLFFGGLIMGRKISIQANLLALPFGTWYNSVFLIWTAPYQLMVPISLLAALLAYFVKGVYPFTLIPLAALIWSIFELSKTEGFRKYLKPSK